MATKIVHDCGTGQAMQIDVPAGEAAAIAAVQQAAQQATAPPPQRAADIAALKAAAAGNPALAAVARLIGAM